MEGAKALAIDVKAVKLEKIDRLMRRVEARQGGLGDFTREKQGRAPEQEAALYEQYLAWRDERR